MAGKQSGWCEISMIFLDVMGPEGVTADLQLDGEGFRVRDYATRHDESYCYSEPIPHYRKLSAMPEPLFGVLFRSLAGLYAAHRSTPLGALLKNAVEAMERTLVERTGSSVYFVAAGERVKIGWSRNVVARISQLQTANPEPISLLGVMPGGLALERQLHRQFHDARLAGEWFEKTPELVAYIAAIGGGAA